MSRRPDKFYQKLLNELKKFWIEQYGTLQNPQPGSAEIKNIIAFWPEMKPEWLRLLDQIQIIHIIDNLLEDNAEDVVDRILQITESLIGGGNIRP